MGTNVYCDHCAEEVDHDDSFVVQGKFVRAYHFACAGEIAEAFQTARGEEVIPIPKSWRDRKIEERLAAVEEMTRRVKSVWVLWLNDAQKGRINPGTFDAMKNLLGMSEA